MDDVCIEKRGKKGKQVRHAVSVKKKLVVGGETLFRNRSDDVNVIDLFLSFFKGKI